MTGATQWSFGCRIGFFGYLMIMFALLQEGITPYLPGLAFLPMFMIATDIGSLFRSAWEKKEVPAAAEDTATGSTTSTDAKLKKEKVGNRKKKR
jgi:hypothetical protein